MTEPYSPKDPDEVVVLGMNFEKLLFGATIQACTFVVQDQFAAAQPNMLEGSADLNEAPMVRQKVKGGVAGTTYLVKATATLSDGRTLVGSASLPVRRGA